jgi:hypothetical protein
MEATRNRPVAHLTEAAIRNHEELFPGYQSKVKETDPELIESPCSRGPRGPWRSPTPGSASSRTGAAVDQALESLKTVSVRSGEVAGRLRL